MSANVAIPIAGFKDVYDVSSVEKALQELSPTANEALRTLYEKMVRLGGQRFTVKPSALPEMERLFAELPNFTEVLADIRKHLALCIDSNDSIELPPMLLLGEPGIGKTHFARKVAGAARHRLRLRADELAHRRLGAVGRLLAVEERQARQGVRHFPERRLRQPGDRGRRARQGELRRPVRSRLARSTSCSKSRPRRASSTSSSSCRSTPRARCGSPPPTTPARIPEPLLDRLTVYEIEAPGRRGLGAHRGDDLSGDPQLARLGAPASRRRRRPAALEKLGSLAAARDAPRAARRVRQRQARRAQRARPRRHPGRPLEEAADRVLEVSQ